MRDLIFLTDRYPYNNSEAFIENEIDIMASRFDRVFILPCGLMVNTGSCREVPKNVYVAEPPCADDIYQSKPGRIKKMIWALKHLMPWFFACLFSSEFYWELRYLIGNVGFTWKRFVRLIRTLGPALRNAHHYRKFLANKNINEAIFYSYWIEPTILFASVFAPQTKIQMKVCRTHRWDLYLEESGINYLAFQHRVIDYIDKLFVISEDGISYLNSIYPEFSNKYNLSRLGTVDYGINPPEKEANSFVIASCSFVHKVKRVDLIVDALSQLKVSSKRIKWIHLGGGQELERIKLLAEKKLKGKIEYIFTGQVSNKDIIDFYMNNHVDLFINVSSSEGIPVSIMEATSFAIPILATNVGGTSEIVYQNRNGFLIEKDFQICDLTNKLQDIIGTCEDLIIFRKESRMIWEMNYSSKKNYEEFYKYLLSI